MTFTEKIKKHLSHYKVDKFPSLKDGVWKQNKKPYAHILPEENKFENLLQSYKIILQDYIYKENIKLHSDFHHLNSSQAMCLNFFFPLFYEHKLDMITEFLGFEHEEINYESICFEKEGLEYELGSSRPTSFDFYFETFSAKKIYFEIKYTENKFGKSNDCDVNKFNKYYIKSLEPINSNFHNACSFFEHYQIFRNLIHIRENSFVVFIYPKNNEGIRKESEKVTKEYLKPQFHLNFFDIHWENIFDFIAQRHKMGDFKRQLNEFKEKYLV